MGFGQVLATLYFIASTLQLGGFTAYTLPTAFIALSFGGRAFNFFYNMIYEAEREWDNSARYYQEFKFTTPAIFLGFLANTVLSYLEWGVVPAWSLMFWTFFFTLNHYHAMTVKEFANVTDEYGFYSPFQATGTFGLYDPSKTQANRSSSSSKDSATMPARIGTDTSENEGIKLIVL